MALIAAELASGREVKVPEDGSLETVDDLGFVLGFQVTVRKPLDLPAEAAVLPYIT